MNIYHAQGLVEEMRFLTIGLWCISIKAMWSSHQPNTGIPVSSEVNGLSFLVLKNIPWRSLKWMSIILSPRTFFWTSGPHLKFGSVSIVFSTAMGLQLFTSPSGRPSWGQGHCYWSEEAISLRFLEWDFKTVGRWSLPGATKKNCPWEMAQPTST